MPPLPPRPCLASHPPCHERLSTLVVPESELWVLEKGLPALPVLPPRSCPAPPQPTPPGWARPFQVGTAPAGEGWAAQGADRRPPAVRGWGSEWERGHPTPPLLCRSLGMAFPMVLHYSVVRGAWSWGQAEPHSADWPPCLRGLAGFSIPARPFWRLPCSVLTACAQAACVSALQG